MVLLLLLLWCSSSLMCSSNEEEGASFYRWRGGNHPWNMLDPLIKAPNRPQTDVLDMLNLANPYGTVIAKAVADNLQKMGPRGASGGLAHLGYDRTPTGPKWPIFGGLLSLGL